MTAHYDLAALGMLVAVAETGGFTAASARLGRTQSAISVRIQDLESQLGHKLLERSRRGVTPTDAGERLIAHARRLLAVEREALVALGFTRAEIDAHGEAAMTRARRDARVAARLEAAA